MKFSCSIEIDRPRKTVVEVFSNPENLKYIQEGFISKELLSGTAGTKGAKSKMLYEKLELIETILYNDLPEKFMAVYEHKYTTNTMVVQFIEINTNKASYTCDIEYTKLNGFLIKIMAKLFPNFFKKQVLKWMYLMKEYCENKDF